MGDGIQHLYLFFVFGWLVFSSNLAQLVQKRPRGQAVWKRRFLAFLASLALPSARTFLQVGQPTHAESLATGSRQSKQATNQVR
jgi:hypothetical protein